MPRPELDSLEAARGVLREASQPLAAVFEALRGALGRLIPDARTRLLLYEADGFRRAAGGETPPRLNPAPTVLAELAAGRQVLVADLRSQRGWDPPDASGSWLGVPLVAGGHVLGAYCVFRIEPGSLTAGDLDLVQALAPEAAQVLENGLLRDRLARLDDELRAHVAEQTRTEAALRASEERYRKLFEFAPLGIYLSARDGTILAANAALAAILRYPSISELLRVGIADLYYDPGEREALIARFEPVGWATGLEVRWRRRDGSPVWIELAAHVTKDDGGRTAAFEGIVRDLTERKSAEERLRQSHKMEAVGRLAGGVAHDFNNLLSVIQGYGEVALRRAPEHPEREIEQILKAGERAAALTRQLLAFSRQQVMQPRSLDLNIVVVEMEGMLRPLIGEDIQFSTRLDSAIGHISADLGQMEQVVLNLVVNARDAMPLGGELRLETTEVEVPPSAVEDGPRPGRHVVLSISDTGVGMSPEVLSHVFEPFFTTKPFGEGTGLGLAIVHGIVTQSSAYIGVESQPGCGTTFRIYFPRVEAPELVAPRPASVFLRRGTETVLVAEDEPSLRRLAAEILKADGYRVIEAGSGDEALASARAHEGTIHLLLTDVVMPRMGGRELAERFAELRPQARILFMSGYTDDAILRQGLTREREAFIDKPFKVDALLRKVREVLDGRGT